MPSWTMRNASGQPPTSSNTRARDRDRPLPDRRDLAAAVPVADAQARDPVARRLAAVARVHAQLERGRAADSPAKRAATRASASGIREGSRRRRGRRGARRGVRHTGVAARRVAAVLGQADPAHAVGQPLRLPAVSDHDDVECRRPAGAAASRARGARSRRARARRQDDAADLSSQPVGGEDRRPGGRAP